MSCNAGSTSAVHRQTIKGAALFVVGIVQLVVMKTQLVVWQPDHHHQVQQRPWKLHGSQALPTWVINILSQPTKQGKENKSILLDECRTCERESLGQSLEHLSSIQQTQASQNLSAEDNLNMIVQINKLFQFRSQDRNPCTSLVSWQLELSIINR